MIKVGDRIFIYTELIHGVMEYEVTQEKGNGWLCTPITKTMAQKSPRVIHTENIRTQYFSSPEEAKVKWFVGLQTSKLEQIEKLKGEIKKKEDIIDAARHRIDYDVLYEAHPELFV